VLEPEDVKKLWRYLDKRVDEVTAVLSCSDGSERPFADLEELLSYENTWQRRITELSLNGYSREPAVSVSVDFRRDFSFPIRVWIKAETDAEGLHREILEMVRGTRPWFSFVGPITTWRMIALWVVSYMLAVYLANKVNLEGLERLAFNVTVGVAIMFVVGRLLLVCFPIATFALGQGKKRADFVRSLRRGGLGIGVATLVSVAAAYFFG